MRVMTAAGLVLTLVASATIGQIRAENGSGAAGRSRVPTTLSYLNERIAEVDFDQAPFDQVIDWIASLTPMNVVVRWQILEDAGIERDKPITMQVRNLRLAQVLWIILDEAGGPDLKLACRASGELLIISSQEDLEKEMLIRVYDVSDLLARIPIFRDAPQLELAGQGGGQGARQSVFVPQGGAGQPYEPGPAEQADDVEKLISLVVRTVEPHSWAVNGGLGTIQAFRSQLVVWNNIRVHQALGGYVEEDN